MNFAIIDITLLVLFVIATSIFLFRKRKNLKREGLLFLYRTKVGMRIIEKIGKKHEKLLNFLSYVSIILGFCLMGAVVYFFGKLVWVYIFQSELVKAIKVPPIMPLIPYLPQMFKIDYLPPFYFIYWIVILAIVAISHEFSHGIFAVNKKVKIKNTGFGFFPFFLPVFLAAFVELDNKKMEKKKISHQMAILSAGTFANIVIAIIVFAILVLFFSFAFTPSGVVFDSYTYSVVGITSITSINNIHVENITFEKISEIVVEGKNKVIAGDTNYILTKDFFDKQTGGESLLLYDDAPAINENIGKIILKINDVDVNSREELGNELAKYSPHETITITTLENGTDRDYEIALGENPEDKDSSYLGVGFIDKKSSGMLGNVMNLFSSFRKENVYYKPNFAISEFIYNLLWWLVLISFSVALMNMLPVGIFDGGRFFYLAILGLTKSEKIARRAFAIMTYLFLALVGVIMVFWGIGIFK